MNFFKLYSPIKDYKKSFEVKSFSKKGLKSEPEEPNWLKYINPAIKLKQKHENGVFIGYTASIHNILLVTILKNTKKLKIDILFPFKYSLSIFCHEKNLISKVAYEVEVLKMTFSNKSRIEITGEVFYNPNFKKINDRKKEKNVKSSKNSYKSNNYKNNEDSLSENEESNKSEFIVNRKGLLGKIRIRYSTSSDDENYLYNNIKINEKGKIKIDLLNEFHLNKFFSIVPKGIYLLGIYKDSIEIFNSSTQKYKKEEGKEFYIGIRLKERVYYDNIVLLLRNFYLNQHIKPEELYFFINKAYKFTNSTKLESSLLLHSKVKKDFNSLVGFKLLYNLDENKKSTFFHIKDVEIEGKNKKIEKESFKNSIELSFNTQLRSILLSFTSSIRNIDYGLNMEIKNSKTKRIGLMINIL